MIQITDGTGTSIELTSLPLRVVSLVPSTTETVFALGGGIQLAGVTRYCVHPNEARTRLPVVGGTKSPRTDVIRDLRPDLILANKEENRKQDVEALRQFAPVYVSFPRDVPSAIEEVTKLGFLLGREDEAGRLEKELTGLLSQLRTEIRHHMGFRYVYLIWQSPYMAAGPETFINAFLGEAGGENALGSQAGRYPEITIEEIEEARPDVVFLSTEPFPFEDRHVSGFLSSLREPVALEGRVLLVDGELLSWHGARMRQGIRYLSRLAERIADRRNRCAG